jgi:hypothetical protein
MYCQITSDSVLDIRDISGSLDACECKELTGQSELVEVFMAVVTSGRCCKHVELLDAAVKVAQSVTLQALFVHCLPSMIELAKRFLNMLITCSHCSVVSVFMRKTGLYQTKYRAAMAWPCN